MINCWSSSVTAHARTHSFLLVSTMMDAVFEFLIYVLIMHTDCSYFSSIFLLAARTPVSSLYFTLWQPHSHHVYIRALTS
jgi:hypothetical protein